MGKGIAVLFKNKFGGVDDIKSQGNIDSKLEKPAYKLFLMSIISLFTELTNIDYHRSLFINYMTKRTFNNRTDSKQRALATSLSGVGSFPL